MPLQNLRGLKFEGFEGPLHRSRGCVWSEGSEGLEGSEGSEGSEGLKGSEGSDGLEGSEGLV